MFWIRRSLSRLALTALIGVFAALGAAAPASATLIWQPLAPFMDPRFGGGIEGAAASIIGSKIYVSDGFRPGGDTAALSIYDIPSDTWTHGGITAPSHPGPARSEGAGGTAGGKHYSIGGRPGVTPTGDVVQEFTPGGGWVAKDSMPTPRRGFGTGSLGGKIYAVGGNAAGAPGAPAGAAQATLEIFDPTLAAGTQWSPGALMPVPVADAEATIALDAAASGTAMGALYVFGGVNLAGAFVSTVQIFDIAFGTWSLGTPMPTARANAMAGLVLVGDPDDGKIAVFGGFAGLGNLVVTELYDPLANAWSVGPAMLFPTSEQAVGPLSDATGIYSIGSGLFGASATFVERLVSVSVPEPSTLAIFALGLAGLGFMRRRRRWAM